MSLKELVCDFHNKPYIEEWLEHIHNDILNNYRFEHLYNYNIELDEPCNKINVLYSSKDYYYKTKRLNEWARENDFKIYFDRVSIRDDGVYTLNVKINILKSYYDKYIDNISWELK